MRSVVDWIRASSADKEWLLLGKGPSFAGIERVDLPKYNTLGLNHVAKVNICTLNHFTDLDAYLHCAKDLADGLATVVLPWFPHQNNKPGKASLGRLSATVPSLKTLRDRGSLLTYNSSLAPIERDDLPVIRVRYFSAVAGLSILATAGIKKVRSLGIDGGTKYAECFQKNTLLKNGRSGFDIQFQAMKQIIKKHGIDYQPLRLEET